MLFHVQCACIKKYKVKVKQCSPHHLIAFHADTKTYPIQYKHNWTKSLTHIEHRARAVGRKKLNKLQVIKTYSMSSKNSCLVCILSILRIPGVLLGQFTGALLLPPTKNVVSIYETKRSKSVNLVVVVVSSPFSRGIWPVIKALIEVFGPRKHYYYIE